MGVHAFLFCKYLEFWSVCEANYLEKVGGLEREPAHFVHALYWR
jgi:hypothetical protein